MCIVLKLNRVADQTTKFVPVPNQDEYLASYRTPSKPIITWPTAFLHRRQQEIRDFGAMLTGRQAHQVGFRA